MAQERRRIFIVGLRDDLGLEYQFPEPTHGTNRANSHTTMKDAIGDMPEWPEGEFYDREFHWYYLSREPRRESDKLSKTIVANPRHMPLFIAMIICSSHVFNSAKFIFKFGKPFSVGN